MRRAAASRAAGGRTGKLEESGDFLEVWRLAGEACQLLPSEKAEISTKCATRTIAVAPLRSSGR